MSTGDASNRGFTLIEVLVVLALLGMLLGVTAMAVGRYRETGRKAECRARIEAIAMLLESYYDRMGEYPASDLGPWDVKEANALNTGIESVVLAFKQREYGGQRPDERWLGNVDDDHAEGLRLFDGSQALLELVDPWGNPIVYIHHGDYTKDFDYLMDGPTGVDAVTVRAARNPLTEAWHRFDSYQLISVGPDGLSDSEDDLANFATAED